MVQSAISGWVKDVPAPVLADLYMRAGARPARPPSKATIWLVITDADAEVFDVTVGGWLMGRLPGETAAQDDAAGQDSPAGLRCPARSICTASWSAPMPCIR